MPVNWGFVGPEGAGKSTALTFLLLQFFRRHRTIMTFPGYNLYAGRHTDQNGDRVMLSKPITMQEMVTTPLTEFGGTLVGVDEIDNFLDSRRSMAVFNLLMYYIAKQRRKSGMGLAYTLQDFGDLDARWRKKTHYLTLCWDLWWSPWGKERGLDRGELLRWTTFDCLGFKTGKPWSRIGGSRTLRAKVLRDYFDSYSPTDIFEGMKKFEIVKPVTKIDLRPEKDFLGENLGEHDEAYHQELDRKILDDLAEQGVTPKTLGVLHKRFAGGD